MDPDEKAVAFGAFIVAIYGIHQFTVGGDGVILTGVIGAICSIGGYAFGRRTDRSG